MSAPTEKYVLGTTATLMSTELNSLNSSSGPSAGVVSNGTYNNAQGGGGGDGFTRGNLELSIAPPAGALSNGAIAYVWFLRNVGNGQEDGSNSVIPARGADATIPLRPVNTAQRVTQPNIAAPTGTVTVLLAQNTGQQWNAAGNTLSWQPYTAQAPAS